MKVFLFSVTVLVIALAVAPGAYACSGPSDAVSPQHSDLQKVDKAAAPETDAGVLVGLLLGIILADPNAH